MKPISKKMFERPIIFLKNLDDGTLLSVDSNTTVTTLDKNTFGMKSGFRGKIIHDYHKSRVVDFTSDAEYFVSISSDAEVSKLFDLTTRKMVSKISRHQGKVSCVGIDPLNRYMFSCGEDGKTFATDIKNAKLAFTLPMHVDSITDIVFSDNGKWLATSSYDKKVFLFNLERLSFTNKLIGHSSPVMKLQFLDSNRLFSIDKDSKGIIWDVKTAKVIKRLDGIHDIVTQVTKTPDNKFLFLATELGYVVVYDLKEYKLLSSNYIKLSSSIVSMIFDNTHKNLILGTNNKELIAYDIYEGLEEIEKFFTEKNYENIYKRIKENPLLGYTKTAQKVDTIWDFTLKKAILFLEKSNKKSADKILSAFKNIPSKNKIIQDVFLEYEEFEKFVLSVKQGKTALSYSLANKHPRYKDSDTYKFLEGNWKKAFRLAQKYSIDPKSKDKAREVLVAYRGVSEKTKLIKELFLQSDVYRRFKIAIGQKDFKLSFELVKQHPFLREFAEYDMLMKYADSLYIKSQKLLEEDDNHAAVKIFRVLMDFDDFKDDAKEMIDAIESRLKFHEAIKKEDFATAYDLMAHSEELQDTKEGQFLDKKWNDDLKKANLYAVDGDITQVQEVLDKYMKIRSKYPLLANVFGWAYMVQLEQAVRERREQVSIENGVKKYILCFGLQEQIKVFFKIFKRYYPKTKLNLKLQTKGSLSMWRPSMIVKSILD